MGILIPNYIRTFLAWQRETGSYTKKYSYFVAKILLIVRNCEISEKYTMKIICLIQYGDEETSKLKIFYLIIFKLVQF